MPDRTKPATHRVTWTHNGRTTSTLTSDRFTADDVAEDLRKRGAGDVRVEAVERGES